MSTGPLSGTAASVDHITATDGQLAETARPVISNVKGDTNADCIGGKKLDTRQLRTALSASRATYVHAWPREVSSNHRSGNAGGNSMSRFSSSWHAGLLVSYSARWVPTSKQASRRNCMYTSCVPKTACEIARNMQLPSPSIYTGVHCSNIEGWVRCSNCTALAHLTKLLVLAGRGRMVTAWRQRWICRHRASM